MTKIDEHGGWSEGYADGSRWGKRQRERQRQRKYLFQIDQGKTRG